MAQSCVRATAAGDCGGSFHVVCAKKSFNYDPLQSGVSFRCDVCAMHRSTVTPRTPDTSPDRSFSLGLSSNRRITLEDLMHQLRQSSVSTDEKLESIKKSSDHKLDLIHKSLIGVEENIAMVERNIAEIRADVSGLSASQEAMSHRIGALEANADSARSDAVRKENSSLRSQVADLSNRSSSVESGHASSDIIISGLPLSLTDTPRVMVQKVFIALGISHLDADILEVRVLVGKNGGAVGERRSTSPANTASKSLLVVLKSPRVRDFIMDKKREHKELTVREIFGLDQQGNVFVKEFLPASVYGLLRRTKAVAAHAGFKYVWTRSGVICVRKTNGSPVILIKSEADFVNLQ